MHPHQSPTCLQTPIVPISHFSRSPQTFRLQDTPFQAANPQLTLSTVACRLYRYTRSSSKSSTLVPLSRVRWNISPFPVFTSPLFTSIIRRLKNLECMISAWLWTGTSTPSTTKCISQVLRKDSPSSDRCEKCSRSPSWLAIPSRKARREDKYTVQSSIFLHPTWDFGAVCSPVSVVLTLGEERLKSSEEVVVAEKARTLLGLKGGSHMSHWSHSLLDDDCKCEVYGHLASRTSWLDRSIDGLLTSFREDDGFFGST